MNRYNVVFFFFIIYCWCWLVESNVILSEKSILNCDQYTSDLDIINQLPFAVSSDWSLSENVYTMDETNTFVVYLKLEETDAMVPASIFCLKHLEHLLIVNMNFFDGNNHFDFFF